MVRLLWFTPMAFLLTLMIFALMANVTGSRSITPPEQQSVVLNILVEEQEPQPLRKQRSVPKPPVYQPEPLLPLTSAVDFPEFDSPSIQFEISPMLNVGMDTIQVMAPSLDFELEEVDLQPVYRVDPDYPAKAVQRGIEGYVTLRFNIDEQGHPIDIEVLQAKPTRIFDRSAIRALKRWRYPQTIVDGKAMIQRGQTVKLAFELNQ